MARLGLLSFRVALGRITLLDRRWFIIQNMLDPLRAKVTVSPWGCDFPSLIMRTPQRNQLLRHTYLTLRRYNVVSHMR